MIKSAMKLVVEPPMTVDLSFVQTDADLPLYLFPLFFWTRRDVEGEENRPLLRISHVPVLTELTYFSLFQCLPKKKCLRTLRC